MTTPANITFQDDEPDQEQDQVQQTAEAASSRGPNKNAKKPVFPKWLFGVIALMLVLIVAFVSSLFPKKSQPSDTPIVQQVPQPVIREAQSAPRAQMQDPAADQRYAPASQPAPNPSAQVPQQGQQPTQDQQGPSAAVSANQADLIIKELARINTAMKVLADDVEKLKQGAAAQAKASPAAPAQGTSNSSPAQKPAGSVSATPARQQVAGKTAPGKKPQEEIITYPPLHATYCVTGLVGTRAFIVKKNPDGTETETSLVVGDRVDGVPVSKIDAASREVSLAGGQRITVSGAGCARDK